MCGVKRVTNRNIVKDAPFRHTKKPPLYNRDGSFNYYFVPYRLINLYNYIRYKKNIFNIV